jgi:hypothetical protein
MSHGLRAEEIHRNIELLTNNLINIKDTTGEFLLKLEDGRVIDVSVSNSKDCSFSHVPKIPPE